MPYLADFVSETATAPGTATTISLLGAAPGLPVRTFASTFTNGDRVFYTITDGVSLSEGGIGTFHTGSPNTLSRDTVKANTSGTTARLNFTGPVFVFSYPPASLAVYLDELNKCSLPGALSVAGLADFSVGGAKIAAAPGASATAPLRADQSWQIIAKYPMAAVSAQAIALPIAFSRYRLTLQSMNVSSNGSSLVLRYSSDGGVTFQSGANYAVAINNTSALNGAVGSAGSYTATGINLSGAISSSAGSGWDTVAEINPGSASGPRAILHGRGFGSTTVDWSMQTFGATWGGSNMRMNYCNIFPSLGGTMTGTAIIEGFP